MNKKILIALICMCAINCYARNVENAHYGYAIGAYGSHTAYGLGLVH